MRRSIRKRLIAGFLGSLLFALVAMGLYLHFRGKRMLEKTVDTFVLEEAGFIAGIVRGGDPAALDRHWSLIREVQIGRIADLSFRVLGKDGKVVAGNLEANWPLDRDDLARAGAGKGAFQTLYFPGKDGEEVPLRVVSLPASWPCQAVDADARGRLAGPAWQSQPGRASLLVAGCWVVQVASSMHRQEVDLASSDRDYLLGALGILGIAAVFSARLVRKAISPIANMIRDARAIHAEDLSGRIEERGTRDELDQLARILNELLARLAASLAEIRQFTGEAAHELRTPLTRIRGEVELLLRGDLPHDVRPPLEGVIEELDRLGAMVRDLLALSRADAGTVLGAKEPLALSALVEELAEQARVLASDRSIALEVGPMEPATVVGDVGLLKRLLWNLLDNAIRYTDAGGRVHVSVSSQGAEAVVSMDDTGVGIPREELARVFDRFYRGKQARLRWPDGAGLGLAVCRAIARAHGGDLTIASEAGKGTRAEVRLPRTAAGVPAQPLPVT